MPNVIRAINGMDRTWELSLHETGGDEEATFGPGGSSVADCQAGLRRTGFYPVTKRKVRAPGGVKELRY